MHPAIKELTIKKRKGIETTDELTRLYDTTSIVATTALSMSLYYDINVDLFLEEDDLIIVLLMSPVRLLYQFA
jgi:hypothetical protein